MAEKFSFTPFSDIGTAEPFVARLFDLCKLLDGLDLPNTSEIKEHLLTALFEGLEPAFRSLREVRKDFSNKEIPLRKKQQDLENVYMYLTIAFKDRFQVVVRDFGFDIGFLFQDDKKFETGCEEFMKKHPKIDADFIRMIKDDRLSWSKAMISVRNDRIDHAGGKDEKLIKQYEALMTLESVEQIFDNCWRAIEEIVALLMIARTNPKYGVSLVQMSEYEKNKDIPHRFGWHIDPSRLPGNT